MDIAAVTPQSTVTPDITVDELDITALQIGMPAQIKVDALGGEKFAAVITDISNTGTGNGGNTPVCAQRRCKRISPPVPKLSILFGAGTIHAA